MTGTRKILLALAVIVGLFGVFSVYSQVTSDFTASRVRDRERHQEELRALEAGEPPPSGITYDERARRSRMEDLRYWISRAQEDEALDREHDAAAWRNAIITLVIAGGLAAAFVATGRKNAPKVLVGLGQLRPGVIVAVLAGLLSGTVLVVFTGELIEQHENVARAEQKLDALQKKLESFEFDAKGNVAEDKRSEFEVALSEAKYAPELVATSRGSRTFAALVVVGSVVVLGLSAFFGRRSWRRSLAEISGRRSAG